MNQDIIEIIENIIFVLAIVPFFLEVIAFLKTLRYKRFAFDISQTKNETFRAIKLRYTNSAKLNIPMESSRSFIEKSLLGKEAPLKCVFTLERFSLLLVSSNLAFVTLFAIKEYIKFTYIILIMSLSFYLFRQACDIRQNISLTLSLTEDYLENTLSHRVKPTKEKREANIASACNQDSIKSDIPEIVTPAVTKEAVPQIVTSPTTKKPRKSLSANNSELIESILQEFLA